MYVLSSGILLSAISFLFPRKIFPKENTFKKWLHMWDYTLEKGH